MENVDLNIQSVLGLSAENIQGIINYNITMNLIFCIALTVGLLICIIVPVVGYIKTRREDIADIKRRLKTKKYLYNSVDLDNYKYDFEKHEFVLFSMFAGIFIGFIFFCTLLAAIPILYFWITDPMSQVLLLGLK